MWTYPSDQEDQLEAQASILGGFWSRTYGGVELVLDYVRATLEGERALRQRLNDVYDGLSRLTSPVFQRTRWLPLILRQSQVRPAPARPIGSGLVVGPQPIDGTVYLLGQPVGDAVLYPAPPGLANGLLLANALTAPTVLWVNGLEFSLDASTGVLSFPVDPFQNPLLAQEPVPNASQDQQITLWLFQADLDEDLVSRRLGYQLGLELPASVPAWSLLNALLDCIITGTTLDGLRRCLDALADAPRAREVETVVDLYQEPGQQWVLTDRNAYRLGAGAGLLVQKGQTLAPGDYLADAALIYEVGRGQMPPLTALTLPTGLLADVQGPLTFSAAPTPLRVTTQNGFVRLDWDLGGDPTDVQAFFDQLQARGESAGKTLGDYLNPLPPTISPLRFLCENVLRGNTLIAVLKEESFGPDALGSSYLWVLRKVLPPHAALLTVTL